MRLLSLFAIGLPLVQASYFSEGWTPGQPVPTLAATPTLDASKPTVTPAPVPTPGAKWNWAEFSSKHLDLAKIMTEGPIASALSGVGINAAEHLEQARLRAAERGWDDRVPMLTDENYELLVKNETFATAEEAEKRIWFVIVSLGKQDSMSKLVDEAFDKAYQAALDAGDAPHVKWARVDYLSVTELTTEWMLWKPPTLMVIRENGQSLRFYQPSQIRLRPELLHQFAATEGWRETAQWSGPWAPGGSRQPHLHKFAVMSRHVYTTVNLFPRWVLLLITGGLGSLIISAFHKAKPPKPLTQAERAKQSVAERTKSNAPTASTTATASPSPAKQRQVKKKA
ncbi:hypothetical protein BDV93DRAFT_442364 [Ceratobasidium sp. AG-I]|nr:hypothetical protein BDV93DRAFT_442364 [Ceratobasidium sp. AG-I]